MKDVNCVLTTEGPITIMSHEGARYIKKLCFRVCAISQIYFSNYNNTTLIIYPYTFDYTHIYIQPNSKSQYKHILPLFGRILNFISSPKSQPSTITPKQTYSWMCLIWDVFIRMGDEYTPPIDHSNIHSPLICTYNDITITSLFFYCSLIVHYIFFHTIIILLTNDNK